MGKRFIAAGRQSRNRKFRGRRLIQAEAQADPEPLNPKWDRGRWPSHPRRAKAKMVNDQPFILAGREFKSRLLVGTGKYKDFAETRAALEASGADIVTVAVRRVNITDPTKENLLDYIDPKRYQILPNTAGCYTVEEAVRTCRLAREAG